jgi:hypothetical protein
MPIIKEPMSAQLKENCLTFRTLSGPVPVVKSLQAGPLEIRLEARGTSFPPQGRWDTSRMGRWRCFVRLNEDEHEVSIETFGSLIRLLRLGPGQALVLGG